MSRSCSTEIIALIFIAATISGCASDNSGAYPRNQARQLQEVRMATVESVRQVELEGSRTPIGSTAGAVIGGIAGSNVGAGNGSFVGAVLGSVVGSVAGGAVEEKVTRQTGQEITVKFDDGKMIAVTQAADERFQVNDRVRVLTNGGATRITH
ncbi:MAG TPA: glycine zipper domain-containing protein [Gallionella sp.]|nr:glycine zipper domain-containing protein [Gallionella sp.]